MKNKIETYSFIPSERKKLPKHFAVSGIYYTFAEKLQLYEDK